MDYKVWGTCLGLLFAGLYPARCFAADFPIVSLAPTTISASSAIVVSTTVWRVVPNAAFQAGEELSFAIRWGLITGGRATLEIQGIERLNDRPVYHLVEEARSSGFVSTFYRVNDRNESWLDVKSLTCMRYEKRIHEGHFRIEENVEFDQINHRYHYSSKRLDKGTTQFIEGDVPLNVLDVLGSLYYLRTLPLEVGESYTIDVYDGKKVWPLVVLVKKREKVKVSAGKFDCFRVQPLLREPGIFVKKGKKLEVWLTADQRRMPVMMRSEVFIGHVSAELVNYHSATEPPSAAK